jgi:hypothetical protein
MCVRVCALNGAPRREATALDLLDFRTDAAPTDLSSRRKELCSLRMEIQQRSGRCGGEKNSLYSPGIEFQFLSCPTVA